MKYFSLHELVPKHIYESRGNKAWELLDPRLLETLDQIRQEFNRPLTVNNWCWGGQHQNRGFRPYSWYLEKNNTTSMSQHLHGRAVDFNVSGISDLNARRCIKIMKQDGLLPHLTGLEEFDGMNWVHIDVRNIPEEYLDHKGLYVFGKNS